MAKKVDLPEPIIPNDSWKVVKLGQYVKILNGYPFDSSRFTNSNENTYPLIRIRDVVRGYTETFTDEDCPDEYKIKKGEILIGMDGDFNISRWKSDFGLLNQRVCKISTVSKDLDEKFLFYYLPIPLKLINDATPSVTVKHLSSTSLQELHFPLPTLAEQQRIVKRIESMFAKLEEAKEKAQNVVDGFETRKAAILHKAFTGELTAKWRKENGVSDDSWVEKKIGECCIPRAGYAFDSKKFTTAGFQIIRMGNLYAGELDLSRNPVYYSENDLDDSIKKRALIADGDILITLTGTKYKRDYGYAVRIDNPNDLLVNQRILCLTPKNEIKTNYLLYYLHSNMFRNVFFSNETGGVNQGNVSSKFVESISFRVPALPEQQEIVRILDYVLEKESRAKEASQTVLDQIALLKKSILARAFRGKI